MTELEFPQIPGYEILELLGKGGMGVVYLAIQKSLKRKVALKVTLPALSEIDASFTQRFVREAQMTAAINHRNVVTVYDSGTFEKSSYMAMEYVPTGTLSDLNRKDMSDDQICELFIGIAKGLQAAHLANMVHRDIKPDNILINASGEPLVTDFGIVKSLNANTVLTQTGLTIGTPKYMSPEQILAQDIDGRSDLYSVGIMLYHFLEGSTPFNDTTPAAIHIKHLQNEPPPLSDKNKQYQGIVTRLLMKQKSDRYTDANQFIVALKNLVKNTQINHKQDTNIDNTINSKTDNYQSNNDKTVIDDFSNNHQSFATSLLRFLKKFSHVFAYIIGAIYIMLMDDPFMGIFIAILFLVFRFIVYMIKKKKHKIYFLIILSIILMGIYSYGNYQYGYCIYEDFYFFIVDFIEDSLNISVLG